MKARSLVSLLLAVLVGFQPLLVNGQQKQIQTQPLTHESIGFETDKIFDKLIEHRKHLHDIPELAGKERQTQAFIKQVLLGLGLEVKTNIYGYGLVGVLHGGKKGKKIAWRADMDALPIAPSDKAEVKSNIKDARHGCGHDVHMAIALGIAEVLAKNRNALSGTVYFIFQPEEETFVGAKHMIDNGLFSKIHPDEIYGLHVTALPVGQIAVKSNEMFAYQKRIQIRLKNELTSEQSKALTRKIHSFLSRATTGTKPWEIQNAVDPKIGITNPNTVFRDYLIMDENFSSLVEKNALILEADLYETESANLQEIIPKIKRSIETSDHRNQLISVSFVQENPTVINDKKLTEIAAQTLDRIFGKGFVVTNYGQVPFFNDDFAFFQQKVPGVYFFLGGSNLEKGIVAMNHAPNFAVDEDSIRTGVKSFSSLIFERLRN
jgi:metal-dependent amidase/aminoacylase/carboxypeptidase family protein